MTGVSVGNVTIVHVALLKARVPVWGNDNTAVLAQLAVEPAGKVICVPAGWVVPLTVVAVSNLMMVLCWKWVVAPCWNAI